MPQYGWSVQYNILCRDSKPGFAKFEIGAAPDYIDAVLDEVFDGRDETQLARLAVDDREVYDAEADLKLRLFIEVVQDHVSLFTPLQFINDAHSITIASSFLPVTADLRSIHPR